MDIKVLKEAYAKTKNESVLAESLKEIEAICMKAASSGKDKVGINLEEKYPGYFAEIVTKIKSWNGFVLEVSIAKSPFSQKTSMDLILRGWGD